MDGLAADLAASGWLAVNVEYRRVGADGGGWPATFDDVRAALAAAAAAARVPIRLVWWRSATRPAAISRSGPRAVHPLAAVVALAPVSDLHEASRRGLSDHAVHGLLGGPPTEHPDRYAAADPMLPPPAAHARRWWCTATPTRTSRST